MTTSDITETMYCPDCNHSYDLIEYYPNHHQIEPNAWCGYLICLDGHELGHHCWKAREHPSCNLSLKRRRNTPATTVYCPDCDDSHDLTSHGTDHHLIEPDAWCGYLICPDGHQLGHHCLKARKHSSHNFTLNGYRNG